jgi:hypothetical protein
MAGISGLREERQIRQLQIPDHPGHAVDGRGIGLALKMGVGEHQPQKQKAGAQQVQAEARFSYGKSSLCCFLPKESSTQGL